MIKLIICDYDGVVVALPEIHKISLNKSIEEIVGSQYVISDEEHYKTYNGLSTKTKLNMLVKEKNLPIEKLNEISSLKQKYTIEAIEETITFNKQLFDDLSKLKSEGYLLACASNALYETVELGLKKLGIFNLFDKVFGNESTKRQKPAPDIYLNVMLNLGIDPQEVLIIEDSFHGRQAATRSGAYVMTVKDQNETTYENIKSRLNQIQSKKVKWVDNKLNIVLPCSGMGSRFSIMGYELIKPLINIFNKPMIQVVVENLNVDANYIFIVQAAHYKQYNLGYLLNLLVPGCKIVQVDGLTEGAACSVLAAKEFIDNDNPLFVINSDQYIDIDFADFFKQMLVSDCDGSIICFEKSLDEKWSYVKVNDDGWITDVKEKVCISNTATIGAYYWTKGKDFVSSAEEMIANNERSKNEFYVAPSYTKLINKDKKIIPYMIPTDSFHSLGTPAELEEFLKKDIKV